MKRRALFVPIVLTAMALEPAGLLAAPQTSSTPGTAAAPAHAEGSRSYVPADFAQFAPRTALDMLGRVPGFTVRQEDSERGLGEATGNVLINGQRVSGKSNDVITELSRIPAQNVQRIDIVDSATLDVPGLTGQVANVIVRASGISGQYAYRPEFRAYNADPLFTRFEVSAGGNTGPVEYTIGLENRGNRSGADGPTSIYGPSGTLIEDRNDQFRGNLDRPRVSGKFGFDGPGTSKGNLNLSYGRFYYDYLETGTRSGPRLVDRNREVRSAQDGDDYEAGGDYEFALWRGNLKFIGLNRSNRYPYEETVVTSFADRSPDVGSRYAQTGAENEIIGRSEYRWKSAGAEWQISAEGAFNSLDSEAQLFVLRPNGEYQEIPLPRSDVRVEEDRYEVMGSYGRSFSPLLSMKFSLGGEYSQLTQVGAAGGTRSFQRPKGELSTAWKASPVTDVNVKLARRVGQLNFSDFVASVNLRDDNQTAGNPDLVPQQSWELEIEGVRNLGSLGTSTLRLYGHLIDDIIDYIPIGARGESPGNLDQATVYGIESRSTFNLDRFRFRGARLDTQLRLQESQVEDPLTGEERRISNSLMRQAGLALRHDVPGSDWAWGSGFSYQLNALSYRLTQVGRQWEGPYWGDVFVEHKNVLGLTLRAALGNALGARSMWDRTVYDGRRTDPVLFVERRDRRIGPIFSFSVRGKF